MVLSVFQRVSNMSAINESPMWLSVSEGTGSSVVAVSNRNTSRASYDTTWLLELYYTLGRYL